jgi:hypothetical protein
MQGTTNRRALRSRSQSPMVFTINPMLAMPRLPAVIATSPSGTRRASASSCRRVSAATSASGFETSF